MTTLTALNLRPATFKMLLLAAGVLLGLLAVALLVGATQAHTAHGMLVDGAAKVHFAAKLKPFGVLWH